MALTQTQQDTSPCMIERRSSVQRDLLEMICKSIILSLIDLQRTVALPFIWAMRWWFQGRFKSREMADRWHGRMSRLSSSHLHHPQTISRVGGINLLSERIMEGSSSCKVLYGSIGQAGPFVRNVNEEAIFLLYNGSTRNVTRRKYYHKNSCTNANSNAYHSIIYQFILGYNNL